MTQQTDIEIKNVDAQEVAISTKRTLYCCISWGSNGVMFGNTPTADKRYQEDYALSQSKYMEHTSIYKFDIDVPNFKNK